MSVSVPLQVVTDNPPPGLMNLKENIGNQDPKTSGNQSILAKYVRQILERRVRKRMNHFSVVPHQPGSTRCCDHTLFACLPDVRSGTFSFQWWCYGWCHLRRNNLEERREAHQPRGHKLLELQAADNGFYVLLELKAMKNLRKSWPIREVAVTAILCFQENEFRTSYQRYPSFGRSKNLWINNVFANLKHP